MADSIGNVLRSLREAAGLSLSALATRAYISRAAIGHVETGYRPPTADLVVACDTALGTTPILATLYALDGDDMRRRTLLTTVSAATALAGIAGAGTVADMVSHGMLTSLGDDDWDDVVATYSRQLVTAPSAEYGASLIGQLALVSQQIADRGPRPDLLRAGARLSQLMGLWQGNQGSRASAHVNYRRAAVLAGRSRDVTTEVYVRARTASRTIYEGATVGEVVDRAQHALALSSTPTLGALEAHSALVHVNALTGNLAAGRRALGGMTDVAERLPDAGPDGPAARTISFRHFLEARIGPRMVADRVWAEAEPILRPVPVWWREAQVYYGLALVRRADVADGIAYALAAVHALPAAVNTIGMAVSDLLRAVPADHRSYDLDELRTYAAAEAGPWVALGS